MSTHQSNREQQIKYLTRKAYRSTDPDTKALLLGKAAELKRPISTRTNVEFPRIGWQVACTWQAGDTFGFQLNGVTVDGFACRRERDAALKSEAGLS